jgi:hypothetical protein
VQLVIAVVQPERDFRSSKDRDGDDCEIEPIATPCVPSDFDHVVKVTHGSASRIGRGNDARIVLEDERESDAGPTFSGACRATMVA